MPANKPRCRRLDGTVICYAYGEATPQQRARAEDHIAQCVSCRDLVAFVQKLMGAEKRSSPPLEPCPSASILFDLAYERLDEHTAQHVRAHLVHCDKCRAEYLSAESIPRENAIDEHSELRLDYVSFGRKDDCEIKIGPNRYRLLVIRTMDDSLHCTFTPERVVRDGGPVRIFVWNPKRCKEAVATEVDATTAFVIVPNPLQPQPDAYDFDFATGRDSCIARYYLSEHAPKDIRDIDQYRSKRA